MTNPFIQLIQHLQESNGDDGDDKRVPEFTVPVPEDKAEELYRRYDAISIEPELDPVIKETGNIPREVDAGWRRMVFWKWLHEEFPSTAGHSCMLEMKDPLSPYIAVYGPISGGDDDDVIKSIAIPDEHVDRLWVLRARDCVNWPSPHLASYYLWRELAQIVPEVRVGNWQLGPDPVTGGLRVVKRRHDHEREEAEQQRFRQQLENLTGDDFAV